MLTPEVINSITTACADLGLSPPPHEVVIFDGKIYRYHCQIHDRHGEKNAWLKCCDNGDGSFGGTVGHWRLGCKRNWSSRSGRRFTQAERAEYAKKMQDARQRETEERERQYRRVAEKARRIWDKADRASRNHDYILKKQIEPRNIRQKGEFILVPLRDSSGVLWSIQFISPAGEKKFLTGGRVHACYWSVGPPPAEVVLICEGMATGMSLHEATRFPVAASMSAGNLKPVALALHEKFPTVKVFVCCDADPVGRAKAQEAAEAVDGMMIEPDFNGDVE